MAADLVLVKWHDAWTDADQPISIEDASLHHAPTVVETIGWLLLETPAGVSLANERYDDSFRGRTFIPGGMVVSISPFKLVKPRKKS